jgi:methyltransferase-like protein
MQPLNTLPAAYRDKILAFTDDEIAQQQYVDFLSGTTFRASILCHADRRTTSRSATVMLPKLHVAARLVEEPASQRGSAAVIFVSVAIRELRISAVDAPWIAALRMVSQAWPAAVSYLDLLAQARTVLAATSPEDEARISSYLAEQLLNLYSVGAIELWSRPPEYISAAVGQRPAATSLARLQAEGTGPITNLRHEPIKIDSDSRRVIQLLDGTRDRSDIRKELASLFDRGEWRPRAPKGIVIRTELYELVNRQLTEFCASSLLVA